MALTIEDIEAGGKIFFRQGHGVVEGTVKQLSGSAKYPKVFIDHVRKDGQPRTVRRMLVNTYKEAPTK
jgi:hypothetical protein